MNLSFLNENENLEQIDILSEVRDDVKEGKDTFTIKGVINKQMRATPKLWSPRWIGPSKLHDTTISQYVTAYFRGLADDIDFDSRCRMDVGTIIHQTIQRQLVAAGALVPDSVERFSWSSVHGWGGSPDGVILPEKVFSKKVLKLVGKDPIHMEIKTCWDEKYKSLMTVADIQQSYQMQAEMYMHMMGMTRTLFVYVNSASFSMKCLIYNQNREVLGAAIDKSADIWSWIARREIPDELGQSTGVVESTKPLTPGEVDYAVRS